MSDYGTMQARIGNELERSDTTSLGYIASEILSAIRHYETERFWFNEEVATTSTVADQSNYALPTDFIYDDHMTVTVSGRKYPVFPRTYQEIADVDETTFSGYPSIYAIHKEEFRLYPTPNGVYTLTHAYVKSLSSLSADADTNAWMVEAEPLIRARARAAFKCNYLYDQMAYGEKQGFQMRGEDFLSHDEKSAYMALKQRTNLAVGSSRNRGSW